MSGRLNKLDNYIEQEKNSDAEFNSLNGVVLLKHSSIDFIQIIQILNQIKSDHFIDVLYISFVRSYKYMRTALEFNPLHKKRILFIDCVSGYAFPDEDKIDDCFYHKPPSNISEMERIILFGIEKVNPDIVVIDSLSQYISFSKSNIKDTINLIDLIRATIEGKNSLKKLTFILLYDTKLGMYHDISSITSSVDVSIDI